LAELGGANPPPKIQDARSLHFLMNGPDVAHDSLQGIGRRLRSAGRITNGEQILLHDGSFVADWQYADFQALNEPGS
jgi:hypothetical protein